MVKTRVLYIHGLGVTSLRKNERRILNRNSRRGFEYIPLDIDWRSNESFPDLLERVVGRATLLLENLDENDTLILEGSSAGGSLAFDAFSKLDDPRVWAVSHSGRLAAGKYARWDPRNLRHCAHLRTKRASQSFYDSVKYFEDTASQNLTQEQKNRMLITKPWFDQVVPVATMVVKGIRSVTIPVVGHAASIGFGMLRLPNLTNKSHPS